MTMPHHPARRVANATALITALASGRAMTLAFIGRAGQGGVGDPPSAWVMPLLGDALIGLSALPLAYALWRLRGLGVWTVAIAWHAVAIWDALSALVIHLTVPWDSFFMIETFGPSMFIAASLMHGVCLWLLARTAARVHYVG